MKTDTDNYNGFAVYCNSNKPLGVVSSNGERTATCKIKTLPKNFKQYLTAIEDKRFYQHGAIDIKGITRII